MKLEKSKIYGLTGSITFGILLILLLLLCRFSFKLDHEEEGLSVNFGDVLQGKGLYEPAPASVLETSTPKPVNPPPPNPAKENLLTQDNEESVSIAEAQKKKQREEERKRQLEEAERKRIEQERIEEQKRVEAEKARQAAAIRERAQGAFSGAGTETGSTGQGTGTTAGNQGNPFGDASSNSAGGGVGSSFKLGGRGLVGSLPRPADNTQVEGVIVIDIVVDENGNVTKADFGKGTNIVESTARNAALSAAKKAKFTGGTKQEIGTITYRFTLN